MSNDAYIIGAVRSPTGKKKGTLAGVHAADLGAHAIQALLQRTGIDPGEVDDVIFGCVDQIGAQSGDIARTLCSGSMRERWDAPPIAPRSISGNEK